MALYCHSLLKSPETTSTKVCNFRCHTPSSARCFSERQPWLNPASASPRTHKQARLERLSFPLLPLQRHHSYHAAASSKAARQGCPLLESPSSVPPHHLLHLLPPRILSSSCLASLTRSCRSRWPRATSMPSTWATTTSSPSRTSRRREKS